jgi:DNA-directed RNA polymerase subunit RPC12/RpoP
VERNLTSLKFGVEGPALSAVHSSATCGCCGEDFEHPLLAMVFSDALVDKYYACPKCLSKVSSLGPERGVEASADAAEAAEEAEEPAALKFEASVDEAVGCLHHLGYLKNRLKNTPIPEECLTCSRMIDCLY